MANGESGGPLLPFRSERRTSVKKRSFAALLCCLLLALLCSGCDKFDASGYVKAVMDNFYLDDSAAYVEIVGTTAEEAHQVYQDGLTAEAQIFCTYMSIDPEMVKPQTAERILALYGEIYRHAKYEVEPAKKEGGGYTVPVRIYPIDLFDQSLDDLNDYVERFHTAIENGDHIGKSTSYLSTAYQNEILAVLEKHLETIGNLTEPVELTIRIEKDGADAWGMSDEDLQRIDEQIIHYTQG